MSFLYDTLSAGSRALKQYVQRGMYHTVGMEPMELMDDATRWAFRGEEIITKQGRLGPQFTGRKVPSVEGSWDKGLGKMGEDAVSWMSMLGTIGAMAEGYATGGVGGAIGNLGSDIAVNAAMLRYGYKYQKTGGALRAVGVKQGMVGLLGRYAVGSTFAISARNLVGGGLPGFAASLVAGHIGVRYGGRLGLVGAAAGGAYLAGNASMGVLKMGHQHRQMQMHVHTSGSMAAFNTQGAATMRQRAVQAIHKSHLNARSALGQEAQFMHFPTKNYHSRYRMG